MKQALISTLLSLSMWQMLTAYYAMMKASLNLCKVGIMYATHCQLMELNFILGTSCRITVFSLNTLVLHVI